MFRYILPCFGIELSILIIIFLILFRDLSDHPARIPYSHNPVGNIFCHHAPRADYCIASDVYARHDDGVATDPDIITDSYADAILIHGVAGNRMERMSCRIDGYIWSHLAIVADLYLRHIDDRAVIVCKEVFPYFDMGAVITIEWWIDEGAV